MLVYTLQVAATIVCGAAGALAAGRKKLDLFGVLVVSFTSAVGGGTLRDLLLDRNPVFWLADTSYLPLSLGAGILVWIYTRRWAPPRRLLDFVDAFGLALFTISGIQIAQSTGQAPLICLLMGVITGVAGGIFRDILCGEIPFVLRRSELYASAALLGGGAYLALYEFGIDHGTCALSGAAMIVFLRFASLKWGWHLPVYNLKEEQETFDSHK
jgi:uncharacterized membrane protein YeiH